MPATSTHCTGGLCQVPSKSTTHIHTDTQILKPWLYLLADTHPDSCKHHRCVFVTSILSSPLWVCIRTVAALVAEQPCGQVCVVTKRVHKCPHRAARKPSNYKMYVNWTLADPRVLADVESITLASHSLTLLPTCRIFTVSSYRTTHWKREDLPPFLPPSSPPTPIKFVTLGLAIFFIFGCLLNLNLLHRKSS